MALSSSDTGPKLSALSVACHLDPGAVGPAHLHCHPLVYIMWFQTRKMLGYEVVIHWVLCAVDVAHQQTKSSPVLPDVIGLGDPSNVITAFGCIALVIVCTAS